MISESAAHVCKMLGDSYDRNKDRWFVVTVNTVASGSFQVRMLSTHSRPRLQEWEVLLQTCRLKGSSGDELMLCQTLSPLALTSPVRKCWGFVHLAHFLKGWVEFKALFMEETVPLSVCRWSSQMTAAVSTAQVVLCWLGQLAANHRQRLFQRSQRQRGGLTL